MYEKLWSKHTPQVWINSKEKSEKSSYICFFLMASYLYSILLLEYYLTFSNLLAGIPQLSILAVQNISPPVSHKKKHQEKNSTQVLCKIIVLPKYWWFFKIQVITVQCKFEISLLLSQFASSPIPPLQK